MSTNVTRSKKKRIKAVAQKVKVFRANEPIISVFMWGINHTVLELTHIPVPVMLMPDDFKSFSKVKVDNHMFNKENLPSHYKIKEYCPIVFRKLREIFGVKEQIYLESLIKFQPKFMDASKSGAKFYLTFDKRLVCKTLFSEEVMQMHQILKAYHQYVVERNGKTLLTQYLGMYRITVEGTETYFVVMRNIFGHKIIIHKKYDLKGSTVQRSASVKEKAKDIPTFKDNDFVNEGIKIHIGEEGKEKLMETLRHDCNFMASNNLMDYSLICGIHDLDKDKFIVATPSQQTNNNKEDNDNNNNYSINNNAKQNSHFSVHPFYNNMPRRPRIDSEGDPDFEDSKRANINRHNSARIRYQTTGEAGDSQNGDTTEARRQKMEYKRAATLNDSSLLKNYSSDIRTGKNNSTRPLPDLSTNEDEDVITNDLTANNTSTTTDDQYCYRNSSNPENNQSSSDNNANDNFPSAIISPSHKNTPANNSCLSTDETNSGPEISTSFNEKEICYYVSPSATNATLNPSINTLSQISADRADNIPKDSESLISSNTTSTMTTATDDRIPLSAKIRALIDASVDVYAIPSCPELTPKPKIYFMAIIDLLTHYGVKKKTAHAAKTVKHGAEADITTVNPDQYAKRFLEFVEKCLD